MIFLIDQCGQWEGTYTSTINQRKYCPLWHSFNTIFKQYFKLYKIIYTQVYSVIKHFIRFHIYIPGLLYTFNKYIHYNSILRCFLAYNSHEIPHKFHFIKLPKFRTRKGKTYFIHYKQLKHSKPPFKYYCFMIFI